tara:strand:+ start:2920 stop:3897 length:978 start_codon:yes stop_codon:yes gene_type:complete
VKKYYLRTSAGGKLGWGNLHRMLIIYEFLKQRKKNVHLHVKGNKNVFDFLNREKINFFKIKNDNYKKENQILKKKGLADISFIEVLNPSLRLQKIYKDNSKKLVVLDDLLNGNYNCDILFCCQTKKNHLIKNINKIYNSYKYFPVNKNYNYFIKKKKFIKKKITKVVVFLGGGDYTKTNLAIGKILNKINLKATFLIGSENSKYIKKKLKKINKNFKLHINYKNIPKILSDSDYVICGGGYSKIEVAYLKTPLIPICVQKHQNIVAENFKTHFRIDFIKYNKLNFLSLYKLISKMSYSKRKKMSNKFSRYFSINGIDRIINKTIH